MRRLRSLIMGRDRLYNTNEPVEKFEFNEQVAEVFDDMLDRSVPFYNRVVEMSAEIFGHTLQPGDVVYDLGCSTGTTLLYLARALADREFEFIGVDNSKPMLDKAARKARMFSHGEKITFQEEDITRVDLEGAGGVILNYTLQFLAPQVREKFLKHIYKGLRSNGVLILSEKVISDDKFFNSLFLDAYYKFKKSRGYSELEIARKREALENVLVPVSSQENRNMLLEAGFEKVEPFFQWFNFVSFVACK